MVHNGRGGSVSELFLGVLLSLTEPFSARLPGQSRQRNQWSLPSAAYFHNRSADQRHVGDGLFPCYRDVSVLSNNSRRSVHPLSCGASQLFSFLIATIVGKAFFAVMPFRQLAALQHKFGVSFFPDRLGACRAKDLGACAMQTCATRLVAR